jgi:hypothetical protein
MKTKKLDKTLLETIKRAINDFDCIFNLLENNELEHFELVLLSQNFNYLINKFKELNNKDFKSYNIIKDLKKIFNYIENKRMNLSIIKININEHIFSLN